MIQLTERQKTVLDNSLMDEHKNTHKKRQPPKTFRPFLWWARWEDVDTEEDKEDIIVSIINEGNLDQWKWLISTYGKDTIGKILKKRLISEFHPESRNLAKVIFSIQEFRHARTSAH